MLFKIVRYVWYTLKNKCSFHRSLCQVNRDDTCRTKTKMPLLRRLFDVLRINREEENIDFFLAQNNTRAVVGRDCVCVYMLTRYEPKTIFSRNGWFKGGWKHRGDDNTHMHHRFTFVSDILLFVDIYIDLQIYLYSSIQYWCVYFYRMSVCVRIMIDMIGRTPLPTTKLVSRIRRAPKNAV